MTIKSWTLRAACRGLQDDTMFPERMDRGEVKRLVTRYCNTCPVKKECLVTALQLEAEDENRRHGIWGGTTPAQRSILAARWGIKKKPRRTNYL